MRPKISRDVLRSSGAAGMIAPLLILASLLTMFAFTSSASASFGLERFSEAATNRDGSPDVQAGSHPYALTTTFTLNEPSLVEGKLIQQGSLKDVRDELPPGFVGNPNATPKCSYSEFVSGTGVYAGSGITYAGCPNDTVVGVATTYFTSDINSQESLQWFNGPVYNIEPSPGVTAEFGFLAAGIVPVFLDASVRTGGDYGISVNVRKIPEAAAVYASKVTIWGVPAEASHDALRGTCLEQGNLHPVGGDGPEPGLGEGEAEQEAPPQPPGISSPSNGDCPVNIPVEPFLTNPTSCGSSRTATLSVDSWQEPEDEHSLSTSMPDLSGCEKLDFSPSIEVTPDGTAGSTPTGLNVDVHVPQEATSNPSGLGEADMKDTTVALPPGVQISPSAADGLQACSPTQIGFERVNPVSGEQEYTPEKASCPDASKIATAKIKTPLLEEEVTGSVYLAAPQNYMAGPLENPFGNLVTFYLVAEAPARGVLVKLAGKVTLSETGQISTTVENIPQFPVSEAKFEFYGTARAPLATPALCGTYNTETTFAPWSGAPAVHPPASFQITSGPELQTPSGLQTTPCSDPLPFSPSLTSGSTNINAGSFSDLETTLSREDGQQSIQSVALHYPDGLSGILSGVKLCSEEQANAGTCGPESQIGETIVSVGLGNDPFTVTGGKVYITGPYEGAPFGLSIVNPAKAGPYILQEGRPVIVRAKIEVNPLTAALTVTTNPSGPYAIPHIIEGIPLQIKHVNVDVDRPGFTFNPTNCNPAAVTGMLASDEGASSPVSESFQVTNCQALKFTPKFSVSTSAKTSKADGASLTAKVTEPAEPQGSQANIARVKVELPLQLPSRLTTLQKACTAAQFDADPAACPPGSFIGHAIVHTPLLPVPLEGPAIFVSHGNESFPSLTMVLQGYGLTVDLVGSTFISQAGVTSTTFKTVPDQPFETFELTLPEGPYSALAANVPHESQDFCGQKLTMPTEFTGQNGAVIKQDTPVEVEGCPNTISISSHKVKGRTATIGMSVPSAGKLTATGKGVSTAEKSATGRETVSLVLNQKKPGKLKADIKLTFTPAKGKKQSKSLTVRFTR